MSDSVVYSTFPDLTGDAPILVLAPHPDDESLGCGGLLAAAFRSGRAHVVCMTDGGASHPGSRDWPPARLAEIRRRELERAVGRLGGGPEDVTWLGYPDAGLSQVDRSRVVERLASVCDGCGARRVFAPSPRDHHADHKTTARIARDLLTARPGARLFHYPIWSRWDEPESMASAPARLLRRFDTSPWRTIKRAAIESHLSQLGRVVQDDPAGFQMSAAFVEMFVSRDEIFCEAAR